MRPLNCFLQGDIAVEHIPDLPQLDLTLTASLTPGAIVQRSLAVAPDAFAPEPGTAWAGMVCALLIAAAYRRGNQLTDGETPDSGRTRRRAGRVR